MAILPAAELVLVVAEDRPMAMLPFPVAAELVPSAMESAPFAVEN
ncbi:hypothetical protein [Burkholderia metallica]